VLFRSRVLCAIVLCLSPDIMDHQPDLRRFKAQHPELASIVDMIPGVAMGDRAASTVRKYAGAYRRWNLWAQAHHLVALPASPVAVACYFLFLASTARSPSPVSSALQGIDWAHRHAGLPCPGDHPVARQTADGLRRQLARPARKMQPLRHDQLLLLVEHFGGPLCRLVDLQMLCLIVLGYHGFFRWDDLHQIRLSDLRISPGYISVFLEQRKNDQFREGHLIPIAETGRKTCAVRWLRRFLKAGNHHRNGYVFGKVTASRAGGYIRDRMRYSCARERLKKMLAAIGLDPSRFCLHSLRSGGVTAALRVPGMPVRLVQRHGGWRRIESLEGYVEETLENLLQVSSGLA